MENCVFCKIVRGEIPSIKVYEDESTLAILDINPANYGHVLVIPKNHHETIMDVPDEELKNAIVVAKKMATKMMSNLDAQGVNIIQNSGKAAGQMMPHFYIHVIPRYEGDKVVITYDRIKPEPDKMKEAMDKLTSDAPAKREPEPDLPPEEKFSI